MSVSETYYQNLGRYYDGVERANAAEARRKTAANTLISLLHEAARDLDTHEFNCSIPTLTLLNTLTEYAEASDVLIEAIQCVDHAAALVEKPLLRVLRPAVEEVIPHANRP
jgi:hypothetical protein